MCRYHKHNKNKDVDSPTVALESVFITVAVEPQEGQDVVAFYIPG